ncbi:MAG: glycosyltransferase [Pseudomonadota bacterium]
MRVAVSTSIYFNPHQTMVNNHIDNLFGGDTCVVCDRFNGDNPGGKAIYERARRGRGLHALRNYLEYRNSRVPYGRDRRDLAAFLKAQEVGCILCEFGTQTVSLAPLARDLGIPLIGYFRGFDATQALKKARRREAYRRMVANVDAFVAVSRYLLDRLAEAGVRHPVSHVLPSGVDTDEFRPGAPVPNRCVAIGRFVEKKQPMITLGAFCRVARDVPGASLVMVGDGPLLPACRAMTERLGMQDRVEFRGAQPHAGVLASLREAEIFLQHSVVAPDGDAEGFPTAIQEAMACGLVVIATRHAGIPEAVEEGVDAFLSDEYDEDGFARLLADVLGGGIDKAAVATRAREKAVERFDRKRLLSRLEGIIGGIAGAGASGAARNPGRAFIDLD